ncbi:MAG: 30S ribosome-binding factor RbfA [Succinivibrionaceae bacterium]|nr:30S ribosome-binding factor RbfA [Succinivibrionaceae bacterium]
MPRVFSRARRVADQMQKEIALLLQQDFKDPRVGFVTVSGVDLSGDLMYAKVFVTFLGVDDGHIREAVKILNEASGFFRSMIASRMKLRAVPNISFHYDSTLVSGMKLSGLISETIRHDEELKQQHTEE